MTLVAEPPRPLAPPSIPVESSAVLVSACEGYLKGATGTVTGRRQGCVVFVPDASSAVASWARPRRRLLVPPSFIATID